MADFLLTKNNAFTTLNGAITDSGTSIVVTTAADLLLTGNVPFMATLITLDTLDDNPHEGAGETYEIVKVTAVSGSTLTVTRAQEGTTGIAFADGDIIEHRHTAGMWNGLADGTLGLNIASLIMTGVDGVDYTPGSDIDCAIATINVTNTPRFFWDENQSAFTLNHTLGVEGSGGGIYVMHRTANPSTAGQTIGSFSFSSITTGSTRATGVQVIAQTDGDWTASSAPSRMVFKTTPSGSTSRQSRLTIYGDGKTVIGADITALGHLHVDQSASGGAVPVLYLDQADVSEEMIEFASTIGTGNAIEAIGAKSLTTTHFIKVTIPGGLTRYIPVGTIA